MKNDSVEIVKVTTKQELKAFINLPRKIYQNIPCWIPPLWKDERRAYKRENNPILANSDFALFIGLKAGVVSGRLIAYVDHEFNNYYRERVGFFGAYESIDDPGLSDALFAGAEEYLSELGMARIRGPINPVAEHWGFLYEGFSSPPIFLSPYNPSYYISATERAGFHKVKDLFAYEADMAKGYTVPERFIRFYDRFPRRKPGYSVRKFSLKHLNRDAEIIWQLTNESLKDNWGYVPVDRDVMEDMIGRLKPILDPDAIWFVEHGGRAVAYCLGFPDLNRIIGRVKGRLFPFGYLRILSGMKKIRHYRLFGLAVHPDYHGMGLDVLLYVKLQEALKDKGVCMEANYILEDNLNIKNALLKLGMEKKRTYRVYEKELEQV
ncbi:MAG: GNAT family N-acetyltransferase [Spirochaetales bacterium]|nr:GNAT family N-acetyltransferase [Spirochaetales bacterium]